MGHGLTTTTKVVQPEEQPNGHDSADHVRNGAVLAQRRVGGHAAVVPAGGGEERVGKRTERAALWALAFVMAIGGEDGRAAPLGAQACGIVQAAQSPQRRSTSDRALLAPTQSMVHAWSTSYR